MTLTGSGFVSRTAELSALAEDAERAGRGEPRIVAVSGPAGMGKSALVDIFLAAHPELTFVMVAGAEAEADVYLGAADALLRSLAERAGKGGPLTRAVSATPLADGAFLAECLADAQRNGAFRRLNRNRMLAILIGREEQQSGTPLGRIIDGPHGRRLRLTGLGLAAVKEIASTFMSRAVSTAEARSLQAHTRGNPLHLKALLAELPAHDAIDIQRLPAPKSFAASALAPLARSAEASRRLVEAAAVFGIDARLADAAWVAAVERPMEAAEAAPASLVRLTDGPVGWTLHFTHPLNRAAVYHDLTASERARLHGLAATRTAGRPALWHRVRSAIRPDSSLAAELTRGAADEAAASKFDIAAEDLAAAAHVHPDAAARQRLLLDAADHRLWAGDPGGAEALLGTVDGAFGVRWRYVRGHLAAVAGRFAEGQAELEAAWGRIEPEDADLRGLIASVLARVNVLRGRGSAGAEWAQRALDAFPPGHQLASACLGYRALALWICGRPHEAMASLAALPRDPASVSIEDAAQLAVRGLLRLWGDDLAGGRADCSQAIRLGRANGVVPAYVYLAEAEYRLGDWDAAVGHCDLAVSLTEDTDQPWFTALAHSVATQVPAARGQWQAAAAHAAAADAAATRLGDTAGRTCAASAAVDLAFARQDWPGVVAAAAPLYGLTFRDGAFEPGVCSWRERYQEALLAVGRRDEARQDIAEWLELATVRGRRSVLARLARPQAALAKACGDVEMARRLLEGGVEHAQAACGPFDQALLHEALGRLLRRNGERRRASVHLQEAEARYRVLSAAPFQDRCEAELAACGLHPVRNALTLAATPSRLTAREQAVAGLATRGLTNRQIAAELTVSVKTVEHHLGIVFGKLGVSNRTQLVAQLLARRDV